MSVPRIKIGVLVWVCLIQASCNRQSPTPRSAFSGSQDGVGTAPLLLPGAPALAKLLVSSPGVQLLPSGEPLWRSILQETPLFADDRVRSDSTGSATIQVPRGLVTLHSMTSLAFALPVGGRKEEVSHLALTEGSLEFSLSGPLHLLTQPFLFILQPDPKSGKLKGRFVCTKRAELFLSEGSGEVFGRGAEAARLPIAANSPFRGACSPLPEKQKPSQFEWNTTRSVAATRRPPVPARVVSAVGREIERKRGFEVYWPKGTQQWRDREIQVTGKITKVGIRLFVNGGEAPSADGVFDVRIPVPPGGIPIMIQGVDSNGLADFTRKNVFRSPQ